MAVTFDMTGESTPVLSLTTLEYRPSYDWVVALLQRTGEESGEIPDDPDDILTYATVDRFLRSSIRLLEEAYPGIRERIDNTTSSADALPRLSTYDMEAVSEAIGHFAAARIIVLPPAEGQEIVTKLQIVDLVEQYQGLKPELIADRWLAEAQKALGTMDFVQDLILEERLLRPRDRFMFFSNPTKHAASTYRERPSIFSLLYAPWGEEFE